MRSYCPDTPSERLESPGRPLPRASAGRRTLRAAILRIVLWHERSRQRRHLMLLDDRLLKDMGLTRADIEAEFEKPFWRA